LERVEWRIWEWSSLYCSCWEISEFIEEWRLEFYFVNFSIYMVSSLNWSLSVRYLLFYHYKDMMRDYNCWNFFSNYFNLALSALLLMFYSSNSLLCDYKNWHLCYKSWYLCSNYFKLYMVSVDTFSSDLCKDNLIWTFYVFNLSFYWLSCLNWELSALYLLF
jgi:hypothetical protein